MQDEINYENGVDAMIAPSGRVFESNGTAANVSRECAFGSTSIDTLFLLLFQFGSERIERLQSDKCINPTPAVAVNRLVRSKSTTEGLGGSCNRATMSDGSKPAAVKSALIDKDSHGGSAQSTVLDRAGHAKAIDGAA